MWLRPHAGATNNTTLMRQRDGGPGTEETWFAITKDRMLFGGIQNYAEPGWLFFGFDHQLPLERWSHVAMVKTTDELRLYVDGALVDTQAYGWPFNAGAPSKAPLTFGGDYLEGNHVPGDLDEIMVYDRALSAAQLAAVYNRGPGQGLAAGVADPVRYYRLDETEGTAAADAGSDGVDAALVDMGAAPWIASTAGREAEGRHRAPGVVALAYGSFGAADLSVDVVQQPEHGTVDLTAAARGQGTYTPSAGWVGTETFTYTVSDGTTTTDPLTAWVTAPAPDTHTWDSGGTTALWSEAANWVGDTVPTDGDSLVFPDGTLYDPVNDFTGLTLHDVTLARPGMAVLGNAITLTGALVRTVADEAEIDWHPDLQLGDEATLGSTAGILNIKAAVSGGDLTKTGAGTVSLRQASSYTGKTVVEAGTLHFNADGALPAGSAVSIADGATVDIDPMDKATTAFDNVFSGPEGATLRFSYGTPMLTGDSSGFAGTTEAETSVIVTGSLGGTISGKNAVSGSGTVGAMDDIMVLPSMRGEETFTISTLTGSYWTGEAAGFGVTDAAGDPGVGYDQLRITGDVDIPAVVDGKGGLMVRAHVDRRDRGSGAVRRLRSDQELPLAGRPRRRAGQRVRPRSRDGLRRRLLERPRGRHVRPRADRPRDVPDARPGLHSAVRHPHLGRRGAAPSTRSGATRSTGSETRCRATGTRWCSRPGPATTRPTTTSSTMSGRSPWGTRCSSTAARSASAPT